jgi:23S rRNA pseudouridine1911/1915/1917 synthase
VITEVVPAVLAGERLDRLVSLIADVSRSVAAAVVAAEGVTVDGAVETLGRRRVAEGQTITIDPARVPRVEAPRPDPSVEVAVVWSDDHVAVVDKPAGLVVHPGAGNPDGTLVNGLLARFPEIADVGEPMRPGIVHRLDAGSSGLLMVARSDIAYAGLVAQLASHSATRAYRAVVWGHPDVTVGIIDAPIGRDPRDPLRHAVVVDGRDARTRYRVTATHRVPAPLSSVECELETGRTHQIRVHMASIGHPLLGDTLYARGRPTLGLDRPFLHAARLVFQHPATGETMSFESELAADLAAFAARLDAAAD